MRNSGLIIGLVVLAVAGVVGASVLMGGDDKPKDSASSSSNTNQSTSEQTVPEESETSQAVATKEVFMEDISFTPATIKVKVGDTVKWTNKDAVQHDVKADDDSSDGPSSELLSKGESYEFTFTKAGTYTYHCTPHPQMTGTVIVE